MNEDKIYPSIVIRSQAEAIELLKKENQQLKSQLKQRDEVIAEAIKSIGGVYNSLENVERPIIFYEKILDILNKYKDEENK